MRLLCLIFCVLSSFTVFAGDDEDADGGREQEEETRELFPGCFFTIVNSTGKIVDLNSNPDLNREESLHFPFISNGIDPGPMIRDLQASTCAGIYVQTAEAAKLIRFETPEHAHATVDIENPVEAPVPIDFKRAKTRPMTIFIAVKTDSEGISPALKGWLTAVHWHIQEKKVQVVLLDQTRTHSLARAIAAYLGLLQPDADFELFRIISTSR